MFRNDFLHPSATCRHFADSKLVWGGGGGGGGLCGALLCLVGDVRRSRFTGVPCVANIWVSLMAAFWVMGAHIRLGSWAKFLAGLAVNTRPRFQDVKYRVLQNPEYG